MLYVKETSKSVDQAEKDVIEAVKRHGFGVLHAYDLRAKLEEKGVAFPRECRILAVCNPHRASEVLTANMAVSTALPCRISVYEEGGRTRIATMLPTALLRTFPDADDLGAVAEEVERAIKAMIDEAA